MRAKLLPILIFLVSAAALTASVDLPPSIQSVVVPYEGRTEIQLCDPEIAGNFTFEVTDPPEHGTLSGAPPQLVYEPEKGFYGEDSFRVAVYSAETEEFLEEIFVEIVVLGPGSLVSPPVYVWNGDFTFSGPSFAVEETELEGKVKLEFYYFDLELRARIEDSEFSSFKTTFRYNLELPFGETAVRIPITLTLDFDPTVPALDNWTARMRTSIMGYTLSYKFYFKGEEPEDSYGLFSVSSRSEGISFNIRAKFEGLTVRFSELDLTARGEAVDLGCSFCDFSWDMSLAFSKDEGFQNFCFTLSDLPFPCDVCGDVRLYASVKTTFTTESKDVSPSLRVSTGWIDGCLRPRISLQLPDEGFGLEGVELYGIEIKCEFAGEITGKFATSFDPERDSSVTGSRYFFEYWRFEGPVVGCCGDTGRWQFTFYFSRGNEHLFGFSKLKTLVVFPLFRGFTAHLGLELGLVDPDDLSKTWLLNFGWKGTF
ncbi:hypothetical protein J7K76_03395 [Candidatus Bipolaricaulota bacterium]|nr:hypothetical protein [Candidatus Bipolaricaulota bacterium]